MDDAFQSVRQNQNMIIYKKLSPFVLDLFLNACLHLSSMLQKSVLSLNWWWYSLCPMSLGINTDSIGSIYASIGLYFKTHTDT